MNRISALRAKLAAGAEREEGFTLIELMVVVLIIAILIAIAIPTFLGVRKSAQDRAAQSSLRNTLTNAKAIYADSNSYAGVNVTSLKAAEPSLDFVDGADLSEGPKEVAINVTGTGDTDFAAAALSESGTCFWIKDVADPTGTNNGTTYGSGASTACSGADAQGANDPKW